MAKYEALEKDAVSKPKMAQLGNLRYNSTCRTASLCWEFFGLFIEREIKGLTVVAEGEEPGSNILH